MKIYLDICCFNRPFDDQLQLRIRIESEAKLKIQEEIRSGRFKLVWSYILDFENGKNPYEERRRQISDFKKYSVEDIEESPELKEKSKLVMEKGIHQMDALHIASAIISGWDYFLTTDDKVLKKLEFITGLTINDPIGFIKEEISK